MHIGMLALFLMVLQPAGIEARRISKHNTQMNMSSDRLGQTTACSEEQVKAVEQEIMSRFEGTGLLSNMWKDWWKILKDKPEELGRYSSVDVQTDHDTVIFSGAVSPIGSNFPGQALFDYNGYFFQDAKKYVVGHAQDMATELPGYAHANPYYESTEAKRSVLFAEILRLSFKFYEGLARKWSPIRALADGEVMTKQGFQDWLKVMTQSEAWTETLDAELQKIWGGTLDRYFWTKGNMWKEDKTLKERQDLFSSWAKVVLGHLDLRREGDLGLTWYSDSEGMLADIAKDFQATWTYPDFETEAFDVHGGDACGWLSHGHVDSKKTMVDTDPVQCKQKAYDLTSEPGSKVSWGFVWEKAKKTCHFSKQRKSCYAFINNRDSFPPEKYETYRPAEYFRTEVNVETTLGQMGGVVLSSQTHRGMFGNDVRPDDMVVKLAADKAVMHLHALKSHFVHLKDRPLAVVVYHPGSPTGPKDESGPSLEIVDVVC
eukprot:gnl/MRDRNA2_/MRDRNA2_80820_c0_seq1.p1 gnl/MRDRNA2_/MRDRNA2_80820_c0~~gnl/MRDRNA2_/MRDRNA2_80820_c0_seq1.p1  ORF type:complete len:487 (+),score=80.01 gnl/MRDRNA2_/MRDRNA2_80820_c0_seq1:58-1518(+)